MKINIRASDKEPSNHFNFDFAGHAVLSADEIWPDGDAPENPTVEDVKKAIESYYYPSIGRFLDDWNLENMVDLLITSRD